VVLLRTARHPAAEPLLADGGRSLDHCYESAGSFEEVYAAVVEEVVAAATAHGSVAYAVPGSPVVLERSVAALRADPRVEVRLVAGLSFVELAFERLGVDPVASGVRLIDAEQFAVAADGEAGPLLLGHCWSRQVLSDVKLALESPPDEPVTLLHHLGLPDEQIVHVPWEDLDRSIEPDHLTCCFVPRLAEPAGAELARLVETVRVLRDRCPWDREQTHESLVRHLVEEAYEVIEAIEELAGSTEELAGSTEELAGSTEELAGSTLSPPARHGGSAPAAHPAGGLRAAETVDPPAPLDASRGAHLEEELGDLLVQVLFHARLGAEEGLFDLAGVARTSLDKLVRRHPHVFGDAAATAGVTTAGAVEGRWEQIKKQEKGRASLTEGIPAALPALLLAAKLERKLAAVGLGWPVTGLDDEQLAALFDAAIEGDEDALGVLLLALSRLGAHRGGDPEEMMRRAAGSLRRRFVVAEELAEASGADLAAATQQARAEAWERAGEPASPVPAPPSASGPG
jgi:tetrapyrrole methylase family protein/MazG family protein